MVVFMRNRSSVGRYDASNLQTVMQLRHECQEPDKMSRYGWRMHDGYGYGSQELADSIMGVNVTTQFVNLKTVQDAGASAASGASNASSTIREQWAALINVEPASGYTYAPRNVSMLFYMSVQDAQHTVTLRDSLTKKGVKGDVYLGGNAGKTIGNYRMRIQKLNVRGDLQADKVPLSFHVEHLAKYASSA